VKGKIIRIIFVAVLVSSLMIIASSEITSEQKIAIPSYFYPGELWTKMEDGYPTVEIAIINPNSGAGTSANQDYANQVVSSKAAGLTVLGYIYSSYGKRNFNIIKKDIDKYYDWYDVDGIFIDEASTECSKTSYYEEINNYIKSKVGKAVTILNPGTQTNECYVNSADIILNFEDTFEVYRDAYTQSAWVFNYPPNRFWHLVHATPTISDMEQAVQLSKERNAGYVYVTPDALPNPWDTLPLDSYWDGELQAVSASNISDLQPPQPQQDLVEITTASYKTKKKQLIVEATSSQSPESVLTVEGFGTMSYSENRDDFRLDINGIPYPESVKVVSSLGGSDTANVNKRG
jgi:hypothetical protein